MMIRLTQGAMVLCATILAAALLPAGSATAEDAAAAAWNQSADLTLADEAGLSAETAWTADAGLIEPDELSDAADLAGRAPGAGSVRNSPVVKLRLRAAPVGLAVEVARGVHVGAAGDFDPVRDRTVGLLALRLSL